MVTSWILTCYWFHTEHLEVYIVQPKIFQDGMLVQQHRCHKCLTLHLIKTLCGMSQMLLIWIYSHQIIGGGTSLYETLMQSIMDGVQEQ
jgi:hypothetical protein